MNLRALTGALLASCLATSALAAKGSNLCILYCADAFKFEGFRFGQVDVAGKKITDLASLPLSLGGAEGGVAAGADDGQFFIPNPNVAYNYLLEVNIRTNTTTDRYIKAPPGLPGVPAFYTMSLNEATGDVYAILEESNIGWVDAATVYPENGTSVALTPNFRPQWFSFEWIKAGVSAVDSKRGLLTFVAGVGAKNTQQTLVGIPVTPPHPDAPVVFATFDGPPGTDIDDLSYSPSLDVHVATCFNISTGVASIWTAPAAGGSAQWTQLHTWARGKDSTFELGNGDVTADGRTLFVAFTDDVTHQPTYLSFDLVAKQVTASWTVPNATMPGMLTAEVVTC